MYKLISGAAITFKIGGRKERGKKVSVRLQVGGGGVGKTTENLQRPLTDKKYLAGILTFL